MATSQSRPGPKTLDGARLRVAILSSRWNQEIVDRLIEGARRGLEQCQTGKVLEVEIPGAYELPFAAQQLAQSGRVDAIVALGSVIRGETTHYEMVAGECGRGIMDVQHRTGIPIGMGVLTVEDVAQALARSEGSGGHNVGEEAALVAVELALLRRSFPTK